MRKLGKELQVGDVIEVWWKPHADRIIKLTPYTGSLLSVLGEGSKLADFALLKTGMTIEAESDYEVVE